MKKAEKARQHRLNKKLEKMGNKDPPKPVLDPNTLLIHPCDLQEAMFASYLNTHKENELQLADPEEVKTGRKEKSLPLDTPADFVCKYCTMKFKMCSALGGHVSKAHPGLSEAYEHKKRVRDTR